ncbi:extracellular catalytic domain type 1 short-chain-length polyhydroxyalkanoate depolymerase [Mesorhizobium australicum]|uniref:extracellular catalytic domain type 1 short-chain-length polyhydroxyalkanoate depolymerase n=1 Tax=Mesorhizobium australicum TaxID=536018 RepID=UPI00111C6799|nr:PHB depolymerase family esterase [Mesorhizobium australicum]
MRKISDTIARLTALQARLAPQAATSGVSDRLHALARFGTNPGALAAKFHVPDGIDKGAPLVVVLHGCTQTAAGYDHHSGWSQLADEAGFALLFPEQQRANNPNLCFNWFLPGDARRGSGEALSIREMIETMVATHCLDRNRIFITGLSAGGAMASAMLASYPEVFAGGAIIAGLPYGSATTIPEAFDRMRGHGGPSEENLQRLVQNASTHEGPWPRISIWHGSADPTVAPSNAEALVTQWRGVHALEKRPTRSEASGRHTRHVWHDAEGLAAIEVNIIAGMAHGTPLGGDGLGTPGPFMLDVGISSTREIARVWGIADADKREPAPLRPDAAAKGERPSLGLSAAEKVKVDATTRQPRSSPGSAANASGVKTIIEDALKAAGLMR